jgi:hypothetical protein
MKIRRSLALALLAAVAFTGCAFKDKSEGTGSGLQPGQLDPVLSITLSWQEGEEEARAERSEKRRLRRSQDQLFWTWDAPLDLPQKAPAGLDVRFDVPAGEERLRGLTVEDFVIEGRRGRGDAGGGFDERFRPLRRSSLLELTPSVHAGVTGAKLRIEGLDALFPEEEQGVLEIRVSIRDASGNWISRYVGLLRTPPSLVSFKQMTLSEFEAGGRTLDRDIKRIRTESVQLELLQVQEVKNGTNSPVELDYPNRLIDSELASRVEAFEYVDQGCNYELRHTDEEFSYTESVYLAAFKGLDQAVAFIGANPQASAVQTLRLEVGETAWIGIYGAGRDLPSLVDTGRAPSELQRTSVQGRCYWQCRAKSDYLWWFRDENRGHPHYRECKACEAGDIDSCNSCRANDPNVISRPQTYCFWWVQTRQQVEVEVGTRTYPITMLIVPQTNSLQLRWPEASELREKRWPHPAVRYLD